MISEEKFKQLKERQYQNKLKYIQRKMERQKSSSEYRRREYLQEIRHTNLCSQHINCIRVFKNNTVEHEMRKVEICMWLLKNDKEFLTEAIFNNNKRCDIVNITDGIIYEVLCSETEKMLAEKIKEYPEIFEIRSVSAKGKFDERMLL